MVPLLDDPLVVLDLVVVPLGAYEPEVDRVVEPVVCEPDRVYEPDLVELFDPRYVDRPTVPRLVPDRVTPACVVEVPDRPVVAFPEPGDPLPLRTTERVPG